MVINWKSRKAICFRKLLGRWQEYQFLNSLLWHIWPPQGHLRPPPRWICWGSSEPHSLVLSFFLFFFGKVIPIPALLLRIGVSHLNRSPFYLIHLGVGDRPQVEPRIGTTHRRLPWGGGERTPASERATPTLAWMPLQKGRTLPAHPWKARALSPTRTLYNLAF